jgi:hypothetical protein
MSDVQPADLAQRLYDRSGDLRDKFVDGRGRSFKKDLPGWFAAFTEVVGLMRDAADCIELLRRDVADAKEVGGIKRCHACNRLGLRPGWICLICRDDPTQGAPKP